MPYFLAQATALSWRFLVVLIAAGALVYALVVLRLLVIPVIVAVLLSTLLYPPVAWLRSKGWPNLLATWAVLVGAIGIIVGLGFLLAPQVVSQVSEMGRDLRRGSEDVLAWLTEGPLDLTRQEVDDYIDRGAESLRANAGAISSGVVSGAVKLIEIVVGALLALVLTFFFVKDGEKIWGWVAEKFTGENHDHVREMGRIAWRTLGGYIRGTAIIASVDALLIGAALFILDIPLALPLTLLTFVGGFFPIVGATTAGLAASLVALAGNGIVDGLIVAGWVIAVQQVEGNVLQPVVMGKAVRLHPVVVLLTLTAGALLAGIAGAFLAVPVAAVSASVGNYVRRIHTATDAVVPG